MKYLMTSVISGQRLLLIFCIHCYFAYIISICLYLCRVITFQRSDLVCDYHLVFWCIHVQILSSAKTNEMQYKLPSSTEELVYFYQILELFKHWALYFKSIQNYTCANFLMIQRNDTKQHPYSHMVCCRFAIHFFSLFISLSLCIHYRAVHWFHWELCGVHWCRHS